MYSIADMNSKRSIMFKPNARRVPLRMPEENNFTYKDVCMPAWGWVSLTRCVIRGLICHMDWSHASNAKPDFPHLDKPNSKPEDIDIFSIKVRGMEKQLHYCV